MKLRLWCPASPLALALAALVFGLDQTHKWWMLNVYDMANRPAQTVTPFFELVMVWNKGVSYGLFQTDQPWFLIVMSLAVSGLLWNWACQAKAMLTVAALALIIGGALSNALDRLAYGAVADFFHFHVGGFSWYVFNLADVAIVAGVAVLLYESLFNRETAPRHGNV